MVYFLQFMARRRTKKTTWQRFWGHLNTSAKDHFIPHAGNNHVPHVLHHRALLGYSVLLILLKTLAVGVGISFPAASLFSSAITPNNIISLTNETRQSLDLPTLVVDNKLMAAAQAKAEDMMANGYFAHTSPSGVTPWYWFGAYGYDYRSAGENLAANFSQAEDVNAGWMASPSHRENIVSDRYAEIGVGVVQGEYENYETTFVVQMFGFEQGSETIAATTPTPAPTPAPNPAPAPVVAPPTPAPTPAPAPVAPTPAPSPSPATTELTAQPVSPETETEPGAVVINLDSLSLTPIDNGYSVSVDLENATEATLHLGNQQADLTPGPEQGRWESVINYNPAVLGVDGEQLYLIATGINGDQTREDLALVMPQSHAPEVYAFKTEASPKLLGFIDAGDVDDAVHRFYIFSLIFLGGALLIAVFVKLNVQKPAMLVHGLAVIGLAILLTVL